MPEVSHKHSSSTTTTAQRRSLVLLEVLVLLTGDERVGELDADVLLAVRVGRLHRHVVDGVGRRRAQARRVVELPRRVSVASQYLRAESNPRSLMEKPFSDVRRKRHDVSASRAGLHGRTGRRVNKALIDGTYLCDEKIERTWGALKTWGNKKPVTCEEAPAGGPKKLKASHAERGTADRL